MTKYGKGPRGRGLAFAAVLAACLAAAAGGPDVKALGDGREPMWDMDRIAALGGGARLVLHHPEQREVSIVHDAPWEGNVCCYHTIFRDDRNYKMYYRGSASGLPGWKHGEVVCYAESDDGITWRKPALGLCEFDGSTANNIILTNDCHEVAHNFVPFYDRNPSCRPDERYKAVAGLGGYEKWKQQHNGLFGYVSSDGIRWRRIGSAPLLPASVAPFDSQNLAFWDAAAGCYVVYYRVFRKSADGRQLRDVCRLTSKDFLKWTEPHRIVCESDAPDNQLYTTAIHPYERVPGTYVGFPKRYTEDRSSVYDKSGGRGVSDGLFMSSRDGLNFRRWGEAFLRPGPQHERWINRNNMTAWGLVTTKSALPGCPDELSLYSTENYYSTVSPNRLRRMTVRLDGFVSANAPWRGGTVTTKPLSFAAAPGGGPVRLLLNASTSGAGFIRCELRNPDGTPIKGFTLDESKEVFGDEIDLAMEWKSGTDVSSLAGKPVVLHFDMKDADIWSYRFGAEEKPDDGGRLHVMWDDEELDTSASTAQRVVHSPEFAGTVLTHDRPWEGDGCVFHCFVRDSDAKGPLLRMYYSSVAGMTEAKNAKKLFSADGVRICYAESRDGGTTWTKPNLGLVDFRGSKDNNCIADKTVFGWQLDNFFVFKDSRPGCPKDELYKAVCLGDYEPIPDDWRPVPESAGAHRWKIKEKDGRRCEKNLWCMLSADGIHFRKGWMMTRLGAFDTLNTAFWDARRGEYHLYVRGFHDIKPGSDGVRDVRHSVSKDFREWSVPERLDFGEGVDDDVLYQLYTNVIQPYFRDPSLFVGFPSRYVERDAWTPNYDRLPSPDNRKWRMSKGAPRYGLAITDCVFIFSRDGQRFFREDEAFMRPGAEHSGNWVYGDCYLAYPLLPCPSPLGGDDEIAIFASDFHASGKAARLNRYRLRQDGFISRRAPYSGAKVVTKPLVFQGDEMQVNFSTSARGGITVTIRDGLGGSITSVTMFGDKVDRTVDFVREKKKDLSSFAGRPVVIEFDMRDADLYSFRFRRNHAQ